MSGPWRDPDEESTGLYPGLVVHDGRVSGSITVGQSRLPLWAFVGLIPTHGWEEADFAYNLTECGYTAEAHGQFLRDLLEMRGEFARLLLVLADAERCEQKRGPRNPRRDQALAIKDDPNRAVIFGLLDRKSVDGIIWKGLKPKAGRPFALDDSTP